METRCSKESSEEQFVGVESLLPSCPTSFKLVAIHEIENQNEFTGKNMPINQDPTASEKDLTVNEDESFQCGTNNLKNTLISTDNRIFAKDQGEIALHKSEEHGKYVENRPSQIYPSEKSFKCGFCDNKFIRSDSLKEHERIHTDTGEKLYECGNCDKKFKKTQSLKEHERTHTGEKPYKCGSCDKIFAHSQQLKMQERAQTGEKSNKCDICDKKFTIKQFK